MRVVIVGSGNVAEAIAVALAERDVAPVQICSRSSLSGSELAKRVGCSYTSDFDNLTEADIYILSISDNSIESVASKLNIGDAIVLHTAGSVDISVLSKHKNFGVLYPLQTFTKGRRVEFNEFPILTEGSSPKTLESINTLARVLTDSVVESNIEYRSTLHLAAVFACNFSNHMYAISEGILKDNGLSFELLKPLIKETTNKVIDAKSPIDVQTGPAIRGDFKTKSKHCEMLINSPITKNIYINLSQNIWEISKKTSQR